MSLTRRRAKYGAKRSRRNTATRNIYMACIVLFFVLWGITAHIAAPHEINERQITAEINGYALNFADSYSLTESKLIFSRKQHMVYLVILWNRPYVGTILITCGVRRDMHGTCNIRTATALSDTFYQHKADLVFAYRNGRMVIIEVR